MSNKTIAALIAALAIVALALWLSGDFALFFNPSGLLLVLGGTLAGVFLAFPLDTLKGLVREVRELTSGRVMDARELGRLFTGFARLQRAEGSLALEGPAAETGHPYLRLGVRMVVDGAEPAEIRERLEQEADMFFSRRSAQRAVLSLMGRLAPAFGLAGTMIGLIRMLHTVKDPSAVAEGMSLALLTTFYGLMLANLIILPLERKLGELTRAQVEEMTIITEGVTGLAEGLNGAAIAHHLSSFACSPAGPAATGRPAWLGRLGRAARQTEV